MTQGKLLRGALDGVLAVHKPAFMDIKQLIKRIQSNLCSDLNAACSSSSLRLPMLRQSIVVVHPETAADVVIGEYDQPDFTRHPRVVGARFQPEDFRIEPLHTHEMWSSGLGLLGINAGCDALPAIRRRRFVSVYDVHVTLGRATENGHIGGKTLAQRPKAFVSRRVLLAILQRILANQHRAQFDYAGVDVHSQRAFELAASGPIRPAERSPPIYYDFRLMSLRGGRRFALRCAVVNERDELIAYFVHQLGLTTRTLACCHRLVKIRHGPFLGDTALLPAQWTLENVLHNIAHNRTLIAPKQLRSVPPILTSDELEPPPNALLSNQHDVIENDADFMLSVKHDECDVETDILAAEQRRDNQLMDSVLQRHHRWPSRDQPILSWSKRR